MDGKNHSSPPFLAYRHRGKAMTDKNLDKPLCSMANPPRFLFKKVLLKMPHESSSYSTMSCVSSLGKRGHVMFHSGNNSCVVNK